MSTQFFISDVHLGAGTAEQETRKEKQLLNFLKHVEENGKSLFIVGDLFDFWFEYRSVIPRRFFQVLYALRRLVLNGITVEYLMGNHDFWLDRFFSDQLGIPVHTDSTVLNANGRKIYIAHGDGLAKKDHGYRFLKKVLRYPLNIKLYRLLHPDFGFALAGWCSKLSRDNRVFNEENSDYIQFARDLFTQGYDDVILGHTHCPLEIIQDNKKFINIGDWITHYSYGKLEKGKLSLEYWTENVT